MAIVFTKSKLMLTLVIVMTAIVASIAIGTSIILQNNSVGGKQSQAATCSGFTSTQENRLAQTLTKTGLTCDGANFCPDNYKLCENSGPSGCVNKLTGVREALPLTLYSCDGQNACPSNALRCETDTASACVPAGSGVRDAQILRTGLSCDGGNICNEGYSRCSADGPSACVKDITRSAVSFSTNGLSCDGTNVCQNGNDRCNDLGGNTYECTSNVNKVNFCGTNQCGSDAIGCLNGKCVNLSQCTLAEGTPTPIPGATNIPTPSVIISPTISVSTGFTFIPTVTPIVPVTPPSCEISSVTNGYEFGMSCRNPDQPLVGSSPCTTADSSHKLVNCCPVNWNIVNDHCMCQKVISVNGGIAADSCQTSATASSFCTTQYGPNSGVSEDGDFHCTCKNGYVFDEASNKCFDANIAALNFCTFSYKGYAGVPLYFSTSNYNAKLIDVVCSPRSDGACRVANGDNFTYDGSTLSCVPSCVNNTDGKCSCGGKYKLRGADTKINCYSDSEMQASCNSQFGVKYGLSGLYSIISDTALYYQCIPKDTVACQNYYQNPNYKYINGACSLGISSSAARAEARSTPVDLKIFEVDGVKYAEMPTNLEPGNHSIIVYDKDNNIIQQSTFIIPTSSQLAATLAKNSSVKSLPNTGAFEDIIIALLSGFTIITSGILLYIFILKRKKILK